MTEESQILQSTSTVFQGVRIFADIASALVDTRLDVQNFAVRRGTVPGGRYTFVAG